MSPSPSPSPGLVPGLSPIPIPILFPSPRTYMEFHVSKNRLVQWFSLTPAGQSIHHGRGYSAGSISIGWIVVLCERKLRGD